MRTKNLIVAVSGMAGLMLVASAPVAHANAELELISGATTVAVPVVGGVASYNGVVGNWTLNVSTGTAAPADGGAGNGIDLNSVDMVGAVPSSLEIIWSAGTYTSSPATFEASIGGTLGAGQSLSFAGFYGPSLLSTANSLTAPLNFSSSPFSGADYGTLTDGSAYYLTEEVTLNATVPSTLSSFDASLAQVPDGGTTLMLLGGALSVMGFIRSKAGKL